MENIKVIPLAGIDEKNKSCYCICFEDNIFIINCGIENFPFSSLGLKSQICDFTYLKENSDKIKGLFVGTAIEENIGGISYLLSEIKNIPIYTSKINSFIIDNYAKQKFSYNLFENKKTIDINGVKITPFKITNTMPDSYGFIFDFNGKQLIYMDNSCVNYNNNKSFSNDLQYLFENVNKGNNILMMTPGLPSHSGFSSNSFFINPIINEYIYNTNEKIIIGIYDYDIIKLINILSCAKLNNIPVFINNQDIISLINKLNDEKYIDLTKVIILNPEQLSSTNKYIHIIIENKNILFDTITDLIEDKESFKISENDSFLFLSSTIPGYEKYEADLFDTICKNNIGKIYKIDKKYIDVKPSIEDIKYIASMVQPKYFICCNCLYMDTYKCYFNLKNQINKDYILFWTQNGDILDFSNWDIIDQGDITHIELVVNNIGNDNSIQQNSSSTFERSLLQSNGCFVFNFLIDKAKNVVSSHNFEQLGIFENIPANNAFCQELITKLLSQINENIKTNKYENSNDMREFKGFIKKQIERFFEHKFSKKPIVLNTIVFKN